MPLTPQELRQRRLAFLATPAKAAPDAKALLDAANSASQTVAVLHVAFMAVCAYMLVIVLGTTDLDLLMGGNNVKLPVIDVAVPIVGFYAVAPYLVVLMHLNLLLQLQLLSRKLFAFDAATPAEESVGGLRDRLHIFPYTYYLVGRPGAVVGGLLGLVVSVTLIVLPLATLLALQLKFLAYQAEGITWAQRVAVFLDMGFLVAMWPVILHPRDDWKAWWREMLAAHLRRKRAWLAVITLFASVALVLFAATPDIFTVGLILGVVAPLLLIVLDGCFPDERLRHAIISLAVLLVLFAVLWALIWNSTNSLSSIQPAIPVMLFLCVLPLAFFWHPTAPRGSLALLSALVLTPLLTLGLMVDGEFWETAATKTQKPFLAWQMLANQDQSLRKILLEQEQIYLGDPEKTLAKQFKNDRCSSIGQTVLSCVILATQRRLDLNEQALFAKPPNPELRAALRAGKGLENQDRLEHVSLRNRSLRRARMISAVLTGADLRLARLQGADLRFAQLQGAKFELTHLQETNLTSAQLQGAILMNAQLQGTDLTSAQLQGAVLMSAQLQGAVLKDAQLQGADLTSAQLQGADLTSAQLQGAILRGTQLQGADLTSAQLQGVILLYANLQGAVLLGSVLYCSCGETAQTELLDVRGTMIKSLSQEEFEKILAIFKPIPFFGEMNLMPSLKWATKSGVKAPIFNSCLIDGRSQPKCQKTYEVTHNEQRSEFMLQLYKTLVTLSCEDTYISKGFLKQVSSSLTSTSVAGENSTRNGLASVLLARMKASEPCSGLAGLPAEDKAELERLAKGEAKRQQSANTAIAGQR